MKLLLVSNFTDLRHEHHALNLLFCEGLQHFHLRKHGYSTHQMARYIESIAEPFRRYVVLHSHFELIGEYGLRGAHFTKKFGYDDFLKNQGLPAPTPDARPLFNHLGFSLHTLAEIKRIPPAYDYLFLSPVFDSISNQGYTSKFRAQELKIFLSQPAARPEVIALGGINNEVVDEVFYAGFDGMALLGYIWTRFEQDHDIVQAVQRFRFMQQIIRLKEAQLDSPDGGSAGMPNHGSPVAGSSAKSGPMQQPVNSLTQP